MYKDKAGIFRKPNYIKPMPKLHLTTIRDTIVTCTQCMGSRLNAVRKNILGVCELKPCFACNGTGQTYISQTGSSLR